MAGGGVGGFVVFRFFVVGLVVEFVRVVVIVRVVLVIAFELIVVEVFLFVFVLVAFELLVLVTVRVAVVLVLRRFGQRRCRLGHRVELADLELLGLACRDQRAQLLGTRQL